MSTTSTSGSCVPRATATFTSATAPPSACPFGICGPRRARRPAGAASPRTGRGVLAGRASASYSTPSLPRRPICTASREYQKLKLEQIEGLDLPEERRAALREAVLAKSCICHDLAGTATRSNGIDPAATPAVCCGPNIVNFSRLATLEEMVGHIYGRISLLDGADRPHIFLRELALYVNYLRDELTKQKVAIAANPSTYFREFVENLLAGVDHYRRLANRLAGAGQERFLDQLEVLQREVQSLLPAGM